MPLAGSEESGAEEASQDESAAVGSRPGGWGAAEEQPIVEAVAEETFSAGQPGDASRQLGASEPEEASICDGSRSRRSSSAGGEAAEAGCAFAGLGLPAEEQPVTAVMLTAEAAGAAPAAVAEPAVAAAAAVAEAEEDQQVEAGLPPLALGAAADAGGMPEEENVQQPASGLPVNTAEAGSGGAGAEGRMEAAEAAPLGEASVAGGADADDTEQRPAMQETAASEAGPLAAAADKPLCVTEQAAGSLDSSVQPAAAEGEELAASFSAAQSELFGAPSAPTAASTGDVKETSAAEAGQWRGAAAVSEGGCSFAASFAAEQLCLSLEAPATTGGGAPATEGALPLIEGGTDAAAGEAEQPERELEGGALEGCAARLLPLQQAALCEAVTADKPEARQEDASCKEGAYGAPAAERSCSGMQPEACLSSRAHPSGRAGDEAGARKEGRTELLSAGMEAADSAEALSLTQRASASLLFGGGSSDGAGGDGSGTCSGGGGAGAEAGAGKGGPQAADSGNVDVTDLPAAPAADPASTPDGNSNASSGGDSGAAGAAAPGPDCAGAAGSAV